MQQLRGKKLNNHKKPYIMTTEYFANKRLEKIVKADYKKLKYCGFKIKQVLDWDQNIFGIKIFNISDEDFLSVKEYQKSGLLSNEIKLYKI